MIWSDLWPLRNTCTLALRGGQLPAAPFVSIRSHINMKSRDLSDLPPAVFEQKQKTLCSNRGRPPHVSSLCYHAALCYQSGKSFYWLAAGNGIVYVRRPPCWGEVGVCNFPLPPSSFHWPHSFNNIYCIILLLLQPKPLGIVWNYI